MSNPCRLVLADDHTIVREGLRLLLEREGGFQIVGEATNGRDALQLAAQHSPEAVVLDYSMPELNGIDAARALRDDGFVGGIVMLSSHEAWQRVNDALAAGVDGYVLKEHAFAQLRSALQAALRRERFLSPGLVPAGGDAPPTLLALLTPRERQVMQRLAEGRATKEIAHEFGLSPKTVESHRLNLMGKLQLRSLAELTQLAVREGMVSL